jgi:DNA-binding CsgD family transcriptional regulator
MNRNDEFDAERLLERFDIPRSAERLWRLLISTPTATTEMIRQQTGLSANGLTHAVAQLVDAQLVRGGSVPAGVVAIDPTLAVESRIARVERDMAEQADAFASIRAQIPTLAKDFARGREDAGDLPGFEIVVSLGDIRRQIYLAAARVRADIRSLEHGPSNHTNLNDGRDEQIAVLKRGVRDRSIIATEALSNPAIYSAYREYQSYGHETRTLANISTRAIIYDRDLAVFPVDPANLDLGAVFIRVQSLIDLLVLMYDHMWSVAVPVFGGHGNVEAPSGRPARILELLALGNTDERIARTLGVGVRTIRREVSDLKTILDVTSRVEISAAAVRKGWL